MELDCAVCLALSRSKDLRDDHRASAETIIFGMAVCYRHVDVVALTKGDYVAAWDLAKSTELKRESRVAYPEGLGGTGLPYVEPNET